MLNERNFHISVECIVRVELELNKLVEAEESGRTTSVGGGKVANQW